MFNIPTLLIKESLDEFSVNTNNYSDILVSIPSQKVQKEKQ